MAAPLIIEAFDEGERRIARIGLCLKPAASEKFAFERGEEALAHGIVVCVTDRTHRGAYGSGGRTRSNCIANPGRSDGSRQWAAASSTPCLEHRAPVVWRVSWPSTSQRYGDCTHRARRPDKESRPMSEYR